MAAVAFDIEYTAERDRLSSALRILYALPHLIIANVLQGLQEVLSFVHWWIILFTGKRNAGIWGLSKGVLNWQSRAYTYAGLMYDTYPAFAFEGAQEPVRLGLEMDESANRLTCALRIIWAIPAMIITSLLTIAGMVISIASWFAILFTGSHPRGMFDFLLKVHRYAVRFNAYVALLSDTYPAFD